MQLDLAMSDGRSLDVLVHGSSGPAIVFHHGTPSAAEQYSPWVAAAQSAGFRWVSFTRAGYGRSTRRPGRSVADNCSDVTSVLDQLGIDEFVAMGWSGGGPHALACAALLAPRCVGAVTLAGVAPFAGAAEHSLDWLAGMGPENHAEFGAAQLGESALRAYLEPERDQLVGVTGAQLSAALGGLVDEADRAVLSGEFADGMAASFHEALRSGVDGWLDDDLAFCRPWGFELGDVTAPVSLWQGEDDRMVPYAHGVFMAEHLPTVRAHLLPAQGHLSIALGLFDEIIADAAGLI